MKRQVVFWLAFALMGFAQAQAVSPQPLANKSTAKSPQSIEQWLMRLHDAARQSAYVGTFVVTAGSAMSSARIWHLCEGAEQLERIEALTGAPRTTFRRNDQLITFLPQSRVAIFEKRTSLALFPNLFGRAESSIAQFYRLKNLGRDRVAGFLADGVQLMPLDQWRFGYRVWTEQSTGLVVKLQTLDPVQSVLEQAAFSDLQLTKPFSRAELGAMMDSTEGYVVKKPELTPTTADQEGWQLKVNVPGFRSVSCHRRQEAASVNTSGPLQCVLSDGLASVSLFIEAFDASRHGPAVRHEHIAMGATHMQTRQIGAWWVTAVGEAPLPTLRQFTQGLERKM